MARGMFWTCKYGANHDFGEQCDCAQEKEAEKQKIQALYKVGKTGQFTFCFDEEEEKKREKAVI